MANIEKIPVFQENKSPYFNIKQIVERNIIPLKPPLRTSVNGKYNIHQC